ncbi:MAG: lysophospholipid acyltransferase family protein [Aeromicrobium sp.]|uniref:lysophospholipid acyltransferase family protein n=1 Tax=Aeromicrobium sp. TaxID=1871063 RepID=UPI0039E3B3F5
MRDITYPPVIVTAKTLFKLSGMKFQMSGTEHIPRTGGAVLAANHIGYVDFVFDGLAAQPSKRLVRFMAKKEAFEGATGKLMRSFHHIPVDRAQGEASYNMAVDYLRDGEVVGIFPEATISRSMEIKELKTGAVRMAAEAGVPLIPMVTWGTQLLKTKDHPSDFTSRGRTVALHVGAPLEVTGEDPVAETQKLREAMARLLDKAITEYPVSPEGQWWAPARHGGTAPTPEEAARLDAEELAARAARRAERQD